MWQRPSVRLCRPASLRDCVVDRVRCVQRRGVVILESLMVLLILVIGLLAVIEWSVVMLTHCGDVSGRRGGSCCSPLSLCHIASGRHGARSPVHPECSRGSGCGCWWISQRGID